VPEEAFRDKRFRSEVKPFNRPAQTNLFGDHAKAGGEVDLILSPRR
jgi:hypothetical protein